MTHVLLSSSHLLMILSIVGLFAAGAALEVITGTVTGITVPALTALTMAAGDQLTVRASSTAKNVRLLNMWAKITAAGIARVRSPRMHDVNQGIRSRVTTNDPGLLLPLHASQPLYVQDTLIAELLGSSTSTKIDIMSMLLYYDDVPGASAAFIDVPTLQKRGVNVMSNELAITALTTGGYSGARAINGDQDNGKNNKQYALVGYELDALCGTVGWKGLDTGNLRIGAPGHILLRHFTADFFARLSDAQGMPLIPVINWANKAATFIDVAQDDGGAAVKVTSHLVELAP